MSRADKIRVYRDTVQQCRQGKFAHLPIEESVKYRTDDLATLSMISSTRLLPPCDVSVINCDTFVACQYVLHKYRGADGKICCLNMTSTTTPGGGVARGAQAQEEELFRRSNYHKTLRPSFYPLAGQPDVIFSNSIAVIKDNSYNDLPEPFVVSCIAAAALRKPQLHYDDDTRAWVYTPAQRWHMETLIDNIFRTAYLHSKTYLVLGAIGCGAYKNDPQLVAEIYKEYLARYKHLFRKIIFAVYSRSDPNFAVFSRVIGTQSGGDNE